LNRGYNYRVPTPGAIIEDGKLKVNVEYPGLIVRYTTDGMEPTINSPKYENPVTVTDTVLLKSFDSSGKFSRTVKLIPNQVN
jgi:hexosaminidase